jgi:hypothetical protein
MELDDLKGFINQELIKDSPEMSEHNIANLLKGKAVSVISKIKKSLWFEIICCILVAIGFIYIALFTNRDSIKIYFGFFGAAFIPFTWVFFYLLKKIKEFDNSVLPVKENLKQLVQVLEEFTKRYFQFNMALLPICFLFAFVLGYNEKAPVNELDKLQALFKNHETIYLALIIAYTAVMFFALIYMTKWYIKKLYGNYISQLKLLLTELKDE